ncbi:endo-1,4-beta-xylanase B [Colletotrichum somersetense]|nr:endo-1,4-beta-xylanase B [Colletotrichum somersetense]
MMKSVLALAAGFLLQCVSAVLSEANHRISNESPDGIVKRLDTAQITYFPAANSTGTGVLVCPGGGYAIVAIDKEGYAPATFLNNLGIDAWVLDYTTASNATPPIYPKPQDEALDALSYIRAQNRTTKLGIWGFSAGGHLSAVTLTDPDARLDFGILAYPVITLEGNYTHAGSRDNLIGANASPELEHELSAQNRVSATTPPTFLFHTADDNVVPVENTLLFAEAMAAYSRPAQVLILPDGPHGLGLALDDPQRSWTSELVRFLKYSI